MRDRCWRLSCRGFACAFLFALQSVLLGANLDTMNFPRAEAMTRKEVDILEQQFFHDYGSYTFAPENFTLAELEAEIQKPMTNAISFREVWGAGFLDLAYEPESFLTAHVPLLWGGEAKIDKYQCAMFFRRLVTIAEIFKRNADALVLEYLVGRVSDSEPKVMDVLLIHANRGVWAESQSFRTIEGKTKWRQLAQAKNPCVRMIGIMWSRYWAEPPEALTLWRRALNENYPYARYLALEQLEKRPLTGGKALLEEFVTRQIDPNLPAAALEIERKLSDRAKEIIQSLEQQPK